MISHLARLFGGRIWLLWEQFVRSYLCGFANTSILTVNPQGLQVPSSHLSPRNSTQAAAPLPSLYLVSCFAGIVFVLCRLLPGLAKKRWHLLSVCLDEGPIGPSFGRADGLGDIIYYN